MNKNLLANFAQICILILVLPIVFSIADIKMVSNFIQEIPIFETWIGILIDYSNPDAADLIFIYIKSFVEAMIIGFCVHATVTLGKALHMKGLPILSTFFGIFIGSLIIKLLGITQGFQFVLYAAIVLLGIFLMVKAVFQSLQVFSIKRILIIVIESFLAVIMCGYVSALTLLSQELISISKFLIITSIGIVALVITWFVTKD